MRKKHAEKKQFPVVLKEGLLLICIALLAGCSPKAPVSPSTTEPSNVPQIVTDGVNHAKPRPDPVKIVLAQTPVPHSALPIVAREEGYFLEEGIEIEVKEFATGKLCFDAMLGGAAQFATVADTPIMFAGFSSQPVSVVATIFNSPLTVEVIGRKDQGVNQPSDLKGKPVGTFKGGNAEYFLAKLLEKQGMTLSDVKVTYLAPPELVTALVRGDLAAISMWEPNIYKAQKSLGEKAVVFSDGNLYHDTFLIAVKQEYARANAPVVQAFLRALAKAHAFIKTNPSEAQKILIKAISIDQDVIEYLWPSLDFTLTFGKDLESTLKKEAAFAISTGATPSNSQIPDYTKLLDPTFIKNLSK